MGREKTVMNIFRLCGDFSHLFAMFILVFACRYVDLFTSFISVYNTSMKVLFLFIAFLTTYFCYIKFRSTYNEDDDKFRIEFILVPAIGLAFLVHHDFSSQELLWTFSIYLESVAIMPQLQMIAETGAAETITSHYLFFLGLYRALYIVNWYYRFTQEGFVDRIAVVAGCVQTVLYMDFFYLYITKVIYGKKLTIPGGSQEA